VVGRTAGWERLLIAAGWTVAPYADEGIVRDVAARLRALTAAPSGDGLREAAGRLGVTEVDLWHVLAGRAPWPSLDLVADVCAAAVRRFGVDPVWLVTGDYAPSVHRAVEEHNGMPHRVRSLLADLLRRGPAGIA
jgi:hypothetical protein